MGYLNFCGLFRTQSINNNVASKPVSAALLATAVFLIPNIPRGHAAFELNFNPSTNTDHSYTNSGNENNYSCNFSYLPNNNCRFQEGGSHDDGSAHYQREFSYGGKSYYHVIIGDKDVDTMYMEYMIEANSSWVSYNNNFSGSASDGDNSTTTNREWNLLYPYSSNSQKTGTGTGNPERVVMRMILDDGVTRSEFLKDSFSNKPLITQTVEDNYVTSATTAISAEFTMDMRGLSYSDNTTGIGEATNRTLLTGINSSVVAADQGSYDTTDAVYTPHAVNQHAPNTSAGKFTYTVGSGFGGSNGTYSYVEPNGFQPVNKDYSVFCKPAENVNWSRRGACTNADGTAGGGAGSGAGPWGGW